MKKLSVIFSVLAVLLSNTMCAVIAYNYSYLLWGGRYAGFSAPPEVAFLYAAPYAAGIIVCVILAVAFKRKSV